MNIADIVIGDRHRKDLGDIESLAKSIKEIGLLHPVVVTPEGELIAGQRRIEAWRLLGWDDIPARVVPLKDIVRGEHDENVCRKDFTITEKVAIAGKLEPLEREAAKERAGVRTDLEPVENFSVGRALDKVASVVGMSRPTLVKAQRVVEAAQAEPEKYQRLVEQMDNTGKVDKAYKEYQKGEREKQKKALADAIANEPNKADAYQLFCGDISDAGRNIPTASIDVIITDPPYPKEYLPLYDSLAMLAKRVLKPGGSAFVMVGQSYLPEIFTRMTPHLRYNWTIAYLTPGGQSAQLWDRRVNTFWKPVLWFTNGDYTGDWAGDVVKSAPNDNDKRFHDWGQSVSGVSELVDRFTLPRQVVLDPFCGGGTTGVVAVSMHRRFVGIDCDSDCVNLTKARILEVCNA